MTPEEGNYVYEENETVPNAVECDIVSLHFLSQNILSYTATPFVSTASNGFRNALVQ